MEIAIYPGSFDPLTLGHLDIINRALKLCDKLIVAVLKNPEKKTIFTEAERINFLKKVLAGEKNIEIAVFDGLLVEFAKNVNASIIIRGVREGTDFYYEMQMAQINKKLNEDIDTVFLPANIENIFTSSTAVKQLAGFHGNIKKFVPEVIVNDVLKKFI